MSDEDFTTPPTADAARATNDATVGGEAQEHHAKQEDHSVAPAPDDVARPATPMRYRPDTYSSLYNTPLGQALWMCLNEPESRLLLKVASDHRVPALCYVEELLLARFGSALFAPRVANMLGHMVRQVLAQEGYVPDQTDVKTPRAILCSSACRYRLAQSELRIHVWRLSSDARELLLTIDKAPQELPPAPTEGSWKYWRCVEGHLRVTFGLGVKDLPALLAAISAHGHARHRLERLLREGSKKA